MLDKFDQMRIADSIMEDVHVARGTSKLAKVNISHIEHASGVIEKVGSTWRVVVVVNDRVKEVTLVSTNWISSHPVFSQHIIAA